MEGLGVVAHEAEGARYLAALGFSSEVCGLVRGHVEAKRYLVGTRSGYAERLSRASVRTLELQGGAMSSEEARSFERHSHVREMLALRVWDEAAKDTDARPPGLESYRERLLDPVRSEQDAGLEG